jgi:hypothetical protein
MTDDSYEIAVYNPVRPVDWQWRAALQVVRDGEPLPDDCDDEAIRLAIRYLRAIDDGGECQPPALAPELDVVRRAHRLRTTAGAQTWIVEARILARQKPNEIAPRVSLDADVVAMYESLFFSVKGRWFATIVMAKLAVGWTGTTPVDGCDLRTVLKWCGYCGGPLVLDAAIAVLVPSARTWCRKLPTVDEPLAGKVWRLAGSLMMPIRNAKDAMKMMRLHTRLMETTQLDGTAGNTSLDGFFDESVRDKVAQMPEECFTPLSKAEDEFLQDVSEEELAAPTWEVA